MPTNETKQDAQVLPGHVASTEGLGPLPPQREGQYLTMTICGTNDDPAECGHWSSPAHVQWKIDKAVAAERERCAKAVDHILREGGGTWGDAVRLGPNAELSGGPG